MEKDKTWLIVHEEPLAGYSLPNIFRVLWDNKFRIHPKYILRFLYAIVLSSITAPLRIIQKIRFHGKIKKTKITEDPIFIIGHYRTGTTYLMTLMAYDKSKGYVSNIEGYTPLFHLAFPKFTRWLHESSLPDVRHMDNVVMGADEPTEDEYTIGTFTPYGYYTGFIFPRNFDLYSKFLTFDGMPKHREKWKKAYYYMTQLLTLGHGGKQLFLKNPTTSYRIPDILEMYPNAKFIHTYRNPYKVYSSTVKFFDEVFAIYTLQTWDKEKMKQGWEEITADLTEDERALVQRRTQAWKTFLKHPERITALAKNITEDFREVVEPQGYKVQIVACDKEACVLYYNELLKNGIDPSEMAIIFSKSHYDDEERYELYKDHYLDDGERKRLIKQFKKRITEEEKKQGNNLKIFIVCNMLLTGFDAPIEQTMYLDSPLRDHNLLQAIARTNRPYDDAVTGLSKDFGRIVDYVGVFKNYNEAMNYDPEDITVFEDVDSLVKEFPIFLEKAFEPFEEVKLEDSYECTIAIVRKLSELDQGEFETNYRDAVQLFEAVAPHPDLREHLKKYRWLIEIYEIYLEEFKRLDFDSEIYAVKTRKLIEESSRVGFKGHLPAIKIDEKYIENLKATKFSPSDKAEKIIRDIETVIRRNEIDNPVYVDFQERLDELIKQKAEETRAIEELLIDLKAFFGEVDQVATLPQRMGFDDRGSFDIFIEIKNAKDEIGRASCRERV